MARTFYSLAMCEPRVSRASVSREGAKRSILALFTVAMLSTLLAAPAAAQESSAPDQGIEESETPAPESRTKETSETISDELVAALVEESSPAAGQSMVTLEIHGSDLDQVSEAVHEVAGEIRGTVPGFFIEARVPTTALSRLADNPHIDRISRLTELSDEFAAGQVPIQATSALEATILDTIGARPWHESGHTGAGQRIGIIDIFGDEELQRAIALGRLPSPSGVFCQRAGTPCALTQRNVGPHGVGVSEIIHAAAPDAELFLASALTLGDINAAVDWFAAQGVTVVNRSQTSEFDGPGDGTGPMASLVDKAVENGMVWVSAAGNAGGSGFAPGQNWVGEFNDPDGDDVHNWADGTELMGFRCGFLLGMRWDDWGAGQIPTDYDLLIFDERTDAVPESRSSNLQLTSAHRPLERVQPRCSGPSDRDYLAIVRYDDIQPDGPDEIQILGNFTDMDEWVNEHAATGPGVDSANLGSVAVGATNSPTNTLLADYSSHGPTFDGRPGIDLAGPACLPVEDFGGCFIGTSASAPVVTGLIAVLRGAGVFRDPEDVDGVLTQITADRGVVGLDSTYGHGVLALPSPSNFGLEEVIPRFCQGIRATVVGTGGDDVLIGTPGRDVFFGGRGNDTIRGFAGNDLICGGQGDDVIDGGGGNDQIISGTGDDTVRGRGGDDTISGGGGDDDINGNGGQDTISGGNGLDYLRGGLGDDEVLGGIGNDRIDGGDGIDVVDGGRGIDQCTESESVTSCRT